MYGLTRGTITLVGAAVAAYVRAQLLMSLLMGLYTGITLALLLARGRLFEVRLVDRSPQSYEQPDQVLAWLRGQLWTQLDGPKDLLLQRLTHKHLQQRNGRYALSWDPLRVGIVTWSA
jgi:hypothetical protein